MVRAVSLVEISEDLWKLDGGTITREMKAPGRIHILAAKIPCMSRLADSPCQREASIEILFRRERLARLLLIVLLQPAADYEEYADDYERPGNRHDDTKTHPYRLVHPVVEDEYWRAQRNTYQGK